MKHNASMTFFNIAKGTLVLALILFLAAASPLTAAIEKNISKSFDVAAGGELIMDVDKASIKINTTGGNTVKVNVMLKARTSDEAKAQEMFDGYKMDFNKSGKNLRIESDDKGKSRKLNVRMTLDIPSKYNLDLKTSGGSINVSELEGKIKANTSGGSLTFDSVIGTINGKTSGGSIKLQDCSGDVDVFTSGGSIRIGSVKGEVIAKTSGGSIKVEEVMGTINGSTSGGSVSVAISKQPKGDCSLKTSGGSISVRLAEDLKLNLDAKTSAGSIRIDFPITVQGKLKKSKLKTELNGGGPELYLRSSGGGISIKKID
ncbi:MAG: DUF4097 domain-containing protein [bacterium]|nr:DUF4097 domain-containing protein [bacterium]